MKVFTVLNLHQALTQNSRLQESILTVSMSFLIRK